MKYKIEFNADNCMGCGACTFCDNWAMGANGTAYPLRTELEDIGCNQQAAARCPVSIIRIEEVPAT
jgi:ferredoxin